MIRQLNVDKTKIGLFQKNVFIFMNFKFIVRNVNTITIPGKLVVLQA